MKRKETTVFKGDADGQKPGHWIETDSPLLKDPAISDQVYAELIKTEEKEFE